MRKSLLLMVTLVYAACTPLPPGKVPTARGGADKAVVFDIDGTLTPRVNAVFTARPDAAHAVRVLADKGYRVLYLSARVTWLSAGIPDWLEENGFPEGSIQVAQGRDDRADPAAFKARVLRDFIAHGWQFVLAYGDSSTDFEAYSTAGIPQARVYALRREGDEECQPGVWAACLHSWTEHLPDIRH